MYITHLAILVHILNITSYTYYILWIMYCILLTLQFRSNPKYKIDSWLGCWAWCSETALNVGKNWLGNFWSSGLSFLFIFSKSFFRKLRLTMGISHGNSFLSSTHMHIFLCILCRLPHEEIYLENVQYMFIYFYFSFKK